MQQLLGERRIVDDYLAGIEDRGVPLHHASQGLKHSIQALIGPDGKTVHVICTRNRSERRRSKWVEPDSDGALGMHDFNGRFTGATVDRWLLGYDGVGAAIERFTGVQLAAAQPPKATTTQAFEARVARAADPARVHSLAQNRAWRCES